MDKKLTIKAITTGLLLYSSTCFVPHQLMAESGKIMPNGVIPISNEQPGSITGVVKDAKGETIPGVTVSIKGKSGGTQTDGNGKFSINAGPNDILVFSSIAYQAKEMPVGSQTTLTVTLSETAQELSQVVVTALGIRKDERKVGYAVTKVGGEVLNKARETNVANSLGGRVAGLSVGGTSGGPGSSARLNIRGATSFSGSTTPLIVINGVPMNNATRGTAGEYGGADQGDGFSNINPDDIETMTVLKGSTASALYGARAANGVIQITTKSGVKDRISIEYNTNLQFDKAVDNTDWQYEYGQGRNGIRPSDVSSAVQSGLYSWGERLDGAPTIAYDGNEYAYSAVTDNPSRFYRTAPTWTNTVAVSGGGEKGTYRLSLSNLDSKSILRNSGMDRKTINFSTQQQLTDKLSFNLMANYVDQQDQNKPYLSDSPLNANYGLAFLPTNTDQAILAPGYNETTGAESVWNDNAFVTNPWFVVNQFKNDLSRKRLISAISAKYEFTDYLSLMGRVGYDLSSDRIFSVTPTGTAYSNNGQGQLNSLALARRSELNTDALLSFSKAVTDDISIDASVGANYRRATFENSGTSGSRFIVPYLYTPTNLFTRTPVYEYTDLETPSYYYTADFSYKNFLTLSTTGRYDTFSTLPRDDRSIFTPSVSGSFIFSELLDAPKLTYGKLRVSYAQTSGEPVDAYLTQQYFNIGNAINGYARGTFSNILPNSNLRPYSLEEFEVGTELKFFNNRFGIDATYFQRKTDGEIVKAQTSVASGYEYRYVNLGSTQNKGIEVMLSGTPIKKDNFSWNTSFNFTYIQNKVLSIDGEANNPLTTGNYRPLNAFVSVVQNYSVAQIMAYDYRYDANGNVVIGSDGVPMRGNLTPMGSGLPKFYGGLSNDFSYKNFNLSFLIDYKFGNKILSATEYYSYQYGLNKATLPGRETGIVAEGVLEDGSANTQNISAEAYYQGLAQNVSKTSVLDGSFIKFRQLTFGYNFTPKILGDKLFSAINVSVVARNLFTIMKHTDNIDPENTFSSLVGSAGVEGGSLPFARTYGVNVNFKFK